MDSVNKTLYIPLYAKSYVSKRGLFLSDPKAEAIWDAEGFPLKGKSKSKWLACYLGIRSAVFDQWVNQQIADAPDAAVIHIGCGLDSRVLRVGAADTPWYDVDFPAVIEERKRYYAESASYRMIAGDVRENSWLTQISQTKCAIVVAEGVSMYLTSNALHTLTANLCAHFDRVVCLMDCYTDFAAKMSKYRNPVQDVGVTEVYGIDDPALLQHEGWVFVTEHTMTPPEYINALHGTEKLIFKTLYAGQVSKKMYRLFEYRKVPAS